MATELATAYVSLLPSAKGFGRKAAEELGAEMPEAGRSAGEAAQGGFSKGFLVKGGLLALGAGAAAIFLEGFDRAIEQDASSDKLAAQLGLDDTESARLGEIAGDLYADAFGESFDDVNDALGTVLSTFGDMGDKELRALTEDALNVAAAFDKDVTSAVTEVGVLISEGLVDDAQEGFDAIVRGLQEIPVGLRDELGDATTEYSKFFADLGFTGSEMFALFARADDQFSLDKTGDAIKEFTIRATDMSDLTQTAFETIGLNTEEMAGKILAGGDTARGAFDQIITGLLSLEDPVARSNAAIALFGTPLEDLGVNEIPAFLTDLAEMKGGIEGVDGAAGQLGDTLNDNTATKIESFKRGAMQGLTDFIGDTVIPEIEDLAEAWGEDGFSGALDLLVDEKLPQWIDDFDTWLDEEGLPAFKEAGLKLGEALWDALVDQLKDIPGPLEAIADIMGGDPDIEGRIRDIEAGRREHGGPVSAGMPYIVGERRPELFVPDTDGYILPHVPDSLGGGATVNIGTLVAPVGDTSATAIARELRRQQLLVA